MAKRDFFSILLGLGNDCGSANAQTNLVSDLEVRP
jgi:hypothetical protein